MDCPVSITKLHTSRPLGSTTEYKVRAIHLGKGMTKGQVGTLVARKVAADLERHHGWLVVTKPTVNNSVQANCTTVLSITYAVVNTVWHGASWLLGPWRCAYMRQMLCGRHLDASNARQFCGKDE